MSDTMFFAAQMAILAILADGAQPSGKLYALLAIFLRYLGIAEIL